VGLGCDGGYFLTVFDYVELNGVGFNDLYPYRSAKDNSNATPPCEFQTVTNTEYIQSKVKIKGANFIAKRDCFALVSQLSKHHGVTLVGYDPAKGYKVKNSWGASWGVQGYGYVSNSAGVCDYAMYAVTGFEDHFSPTNC
jgi:C1A family cysteine protease